MAVTDVQSSSSPQCPCLSADVFISTMRFACARAESIQMSRICAAIKMIPVHQRVRLNWLSQAIAPEVMGRETRRGEKKRPHATATNTTDIDASGIQYKTALNRRPGSSRAPITSKRGRGNRKPDFARALCINDDRLCFGNISRQRNFRNQHSARAVEHLFFAE